MTIKLATINSILEKIGLVLAVQMSGTHQVDGTFRFDDGPTLLHLKKR